MVDGLEFTADWFSENVPVWREMLRRFPPKRVLEIGSYEGRSASFLLSECESLVELVCVDTWEGGAEHDKTAMPAVERRFDANVQSALAQRATPIRLRKIKSRSSLALPALIAANEPRFDLIYVDGSHEASNVLVDAVYAFQLLAVDGILIFDDYLWRDGTNDILNWPKTAIDAFVNCFHRKLIVFDGKPLYQLYLQKTSD
jgi:predicted O-methyltransferase YrrM